MPKSRHPVSRGRQRRVRVRGIRREQIDTHKLTRALIALAEAQAEADAEAQAPQAGAKGEDAS